MSTTQKTDKKAIAFILIFAFLLVITIGGARIAIDEHVHAERVQKARIARDSLTIDSLSNQLSWYQIHWEYNNDDQQ